MNKTFYNFLLYFLTFVSCIFIFTTPSHAQRPPATAVTPPAIKGVVGPCDPNVYMQLVDVAEMQAYNQQAIMRRATEEKGDPSILSLSCIEADLTKLLKKNEDIIKLGGRDIDYSSFSAFFNSAIDEVGKEIEKASNKFSCENLNKFVQYQLDHCFSSKLLERQSSGRLGNQACLIDVNARVTVNRHGYAYTGISASGSVSGPGGFQESVLLGGDIVQGLEGLYTNWSEDTSTYTPLGNSCGQLDPTIVNNYPQSYYDALTPGAIPNGVTTDGTNYTYTNVGTYTSIVNGTPTAVSYEDDATCYGFTPTIPYVPCGYEADGITPASCDPGPSSDPSCCDLAQRDCAVMNLPACPCTQGNLAAFENGACVQGTPTCCNGDLNDCTLPEYAGFGYCEGTDPAQQEEPVDCSAVQQDLQSQLVYSDEEILANCDPGIVEDVYAEKINICNSKNGIGSGCKSIPFCERGGGLLPGCQIKGDVVRQLAIEACRAAQTNQNIIDNFDFQGCDVNLGGATTNGGSTGTGSNGGGFTGGGGSGGGSGGAGVLDIIQRFSPANTGRTSPSPATTKPAPVAAPKPAPVVTTKPATTTKPPVAKPTTTPSAGSSSGGGASSGGVSKPSLLESLF